MDIGQLEIKHESKLKYSINGVWEDLLKAIYLIPNKCSFHSHLSILQLTYVHFQMSAIHPEVKQIYLSEIGLLNKNTFYSNSCLTDDFMICLVCFCFLLRSL